MVKIIKILFRPILNRWNRLLVVIRFQLTNPTIKLGDNIVVNDVSAGEFVYISSNSRIKKSSLGSYSYCGGNAKITSATIGRFTCIGPNVTIGLGSHPIEKHVSVHPAFYSLASQVGRTFVEKQVFDERPQHTVIGNDVWIGANVTIPGGIVIGDGAIIASGAVVVKNVQPFAIVGGVPARFIRFRHGKEHIYVLRRTKWWEKSNEWLAENVKYFEDINSFVENCNPPE